MKFNPYHLDRPPSRDAERTIAEIDCVLHAVFDVAKGPDPEDVARLYAMLNPGRPEELERVRLAEAA